jgi:hypothetical protein
VQALEVSGPGPFQWRIDIGEREPGAQLLYRVNCPDAFVPALSEPGSQDRRALAFLLDACRLLPDAAG